MKTCSFPGCARAHSARGYCNGHYQQLKSGRPLSMLRQDVPVEDRFWSKVDKSAECWIWHSTRIWNGYGHFRANGKKVLAHRWIYEHHFGPIADGLVVDHMCHARECVNPAHLQVVSRKENNENLQGPRKGNISGVRGVTWYEPGRSWKAGLSHNGKQIHLGYFSTIRAAEEAVVARRNELFTNSLMDKEIPA